MKSTRTLKDGRWLLMNHNHKRSVDIESGGKKMSDKSDVYPTFLSVYNSPFIRAEG